MRKLALLLVCFFISSGLVIAQSGQISGIVVNENGETVMEASVVLEGTNLQVQLAPNTKALGEVVVTALGVSRNKKTLGYATSSFTGQEIANSKTVNPMQALQGKVAGLEISSAPVPGGTQNVNIRGFNVLNRSSQPLYIVDGIPLTNIQNQAGNLMIGANTLNSQADFGSGINALDPDNIENITVLKGSAASALYGSRAAQGVIMITTKSGKNTGGKLNVDYSGGLSIQQIGRLPLEQTMFGQGWSGNRALNENGNWGARFDGKNRVWGNVVDGEQQIKPYLYQKNRIRDFYDLGIGYNNALSLNGGTEQTKFHFFASQNYLDGPVPTNADSYKRFTAAANASHKTSKILLGSSFNFSVEKNKVSPTGQDNSIYRSLNEIATDLSIVDLKDFNNKFNNTDNYFTPYGMNPYYMLHIKDANQNKYKFFGKAQLDYNPIKKLKLTCRFGGDFETSIAEMHLDPIFFSEDSPNFGSANETPGNYSQIRRQRIQTNLDFFATYTDRFNYFSLNAVAGFNSNEMANEALEGEINSIDIPGFYNLSNSLTPAVARQFYDLYRIMGVYLNADLGYKDYLYLTLTARNDRSSTLPTNNNSYFYPASMLSFIVTDFMQHQDISTSVLDFAKIRLAYGRTGKDAPLYGVYERYVVGEITNPGFPKVNNLIFPLGGINAYTLSDRAGNPNLKPELTDEFEIGFESFFLNNRIGIDFSFYNKFTKDLIDVLSLDPTTAYTAQIANLGDVRNRGIELSVSLIPLKTKNFKWNIAYNFTKNNNKVERLNAEEIFLGGYGGMGIYAVEGKSLGQFKSRKALSVLLDDGIIHTVVDGKGNPQPTPDMEYLDKDVNEKYRMGFTNTFTYKGIALSGTFDFRYGGSIYCYTKEYMHWVGSSPETVYNNRNPFIIPNSVIDNGDGTYSKNTTPVDPTALHTFYSNGGFQYADFAVIDRSYLKLRNISLAYLLPESICSKLKLSGLRASFTASNFLLWTPKENRYIDTEVTTWGSNMAAKFGEYGLTPPYRSYVFGLNFSF